MKKSFFESCCIVNYSSGIYLNGQKRLKQSLIDNGYTGDFLFFDDSDVSFPLQSEIPYGFKLKAVSIAIEKGYKYILWLDSNLVCIRQPKKIFSIIKNQDIYVYSPYADKMGYWCSDLALQSFSIERNQAFEIDELCAAIFGINADSKKTVDFFAEWNNFAKDGKTFKGLSEEYDIKDSFKNLNNIVSKDNRVKGHRHDQTALSFLAWKYKLDIHYLEVKDVCAVNAATLKHKYSKAISFDVEIAQNRDIKTQKYFEHYNRWGNTKGINKFCFICLSFVDTIKRRLFLLKR